MSKQPHVWVVESGPGIHSPLMTAYAKKAVAVKGAASLRSWGIYAKACVAKYVRVEPKKGRKT